MLLISSTSRARVHQPAVSSCDSSASTQAHPRPPGLFGPPTPGCAVRRGRGFQHLVEREGYGARGAFLDSHGV
ncbi:unnamed protein product [Lota lota]